MYLWCAGQAHAWYFVHFLAMYLWCTGLEHWPLPPVTSPSLDKWTNRWSSSAINSSCALCLSVLVSTDAAGVSATKKIEPPSPPSSSSWVRSTKTRAGFTTNLALINSWLASTCSTWASKHCNIQWSSQWAVVNSLISSIYLHWTWRSLFNFSTNLIKVSTSIQSWQHWRKNPSQLSCFSPFFHQFPPSPSERRN